MTEMTREGLQALLAPVTGYVGGRPLDEELEIGLNASFPPGGEVFKAIETACHEAIRGGWMCKYEEGGIRYGRVIKPVEALHGFSVDVVDMDNVRGPHHRHPRGEIDLVMPVAGEAKFNGKGAGWKVYEAGSAHYPVVSDGRALVLYLLPGGEIEFTGR